MVVVYGPRPAYEWELAIDDVLEKSLLQESKESMMVPKNILEGTRPRRSAPLPARVGCHNVLHTLPAAL